MKRFGGRRGGQERNAHTGIRYERGGAGRHGALLGLPEGEVVIIPYSWLPSPSSSHGTSWNEEERGTRTEEGRRYKYFVSPLRARTSACGICQIWARSWTQDTTCSNFFTPHKACVGNFLRLLISPIWAETPSKIVQINNHHAELARERWSCLFVRFFSKTQRAMPQKWTSVTEPSSYSLNDVQIQCGLLRKSTNNWSHSLLY